MIPVIFGSPLVRVEVQFHSFLISLLEHPSGQLHAYGPAALNSEKELILLIEYEACELQMSDVCILTH